MMIWSSHVQDLTQVLCSCLQCFLLLVCFLNELRRSEYFNFLIVECGGSFIFLSQKRELQGREEFVFRTSFTPWREWLCLLWSTALCELSYSQRCLQLSLSHSSYSKTKCNKRCVWAFSFTSSLGHSCKELLQFWVKLWVKLWVPTSPAHDKALSAKLFNW